MDYDKILEREIKLGVMIHYLPKVEGDLLRISVDVETDGINFWSDSVRLLKQATFCFDGETGERLRGGKFIRKVTSAPDPLSLPWPSDDDDPFCSNVRACAIYIEEARFMRALREIRDFLAAGLGRKNAYICVQNYPTS